MKNKKTARKWIELAVLALLLFWLLHPAWIPFLDDATRAAVTSMLQNTFSAGANGGTVPFGWPTWITLCAMIAMVLLAAALLRLVLRGVRAERGRKKTVASLLDGLTRYATALVILIWGLSILGVNIAGIFAGLGILSIVVGFGAQSLVEDILTGIFIIFEGQYNVGDVIVLDDFRGTVRSIGVRTTCIEDMGGNYKIINNSDIRNLQNRSLEKSVAICDVGVAYRYGVDEILKLFSKKLPKMMERYPGLFLGAPHCVGVQELAESAVVYRIIADVREENIFNAQRAMNADVKRILDENGVEIPFPQRTIHMENA